LTGTNLFLVLASGEINGFGYWFINTTVHDSPTKVDKNLIELHRKELIGEESAKDILFAIFFNINNLKNDLNRDGFVIDNPPKGISFSFPLNVLENIFDFWVELYKVSPTLEKSARNPMPSERNPDPLGRIQKRSELAAEREMEQEYSVAQLLQGKGAAEVKEGEKIEKAKNA